MPAETLIFQDENITITTQPLLAHGKTYAISHISSVEVQDLGRGCRAIAGWFLACTGVVDIAAAACLVAFGFDSDPLFSLGPINGLVAFFLSSILILFTGILILRSARSKCAVTIATSGSVIDLSGSYSPLSIRILESADKNYIQAINSHVSRAIALRG
jgi:hypothetical protein